MSLFGKKSPYDVDNDGLQRKKTRKPITKEAKKTALLLLMNTLLALLLAGVLYVPLKRYYAGQDLLK